MPMQCMCSCVSAADIDRAAVLSISIGTARDYLYIDTNACFDFSSLLKGIHCCTDQFQAAAMPAGRARAIVMNFDLLVSLVAWVIDFGVEELVRFIRYSWYSCRSKKFAPPLAS